MHTVTEIVHKKYAGNIEKEVLYDLKHFCALKNIN